MERQTEDPKPPTMEEIRKRRLAYFQSTSRENLFESPPTDRPNLEEEKQEQDRISQSIKDGVAGPQRVEECTSVIHEKNWKEPQNEFIPEREHGKPAGRSSAAHAKISENVKPHVPVQGISGNQERLSRPAENKMSSSKAAAKSSATAGDDILSSDWNSHVEHLFKREQQRVKEEKGLSRKDSHELLRESQDIDAVSMFKSEVDCDDLGLATHRPESDRPSLTQNRNNSNAAGFLEDSLSQEMKNLLGEAKYQEFVQKSVKDINELYHHKTTETSPHLIKSLIEDQSKTSETKGRRDSGDEGQTAGRDETNSRQMNNRANSRSPRHRLHRPRNEPVHIQNLVTKTKRDLELEGSEVAPSSGKNYEQVTVSRNVTFSADEIYRQAFGIPAPPFQQMMPPSPVAYNQGMPFHPAMMMNMAPPQGGFQSPHGPYFPPDFSQPPPTYMYPNQPDMFTPRTPTTPTSPHPVYYPQYQGDPNFHGVMTDPNFHRGYQGFGSVYQSQPFQTPGFPPQYVNYPPPVHIPHPPPQPPAMNVQHPPLQGMPQGMPQGMGMYYPYPQNVPKIPHPPAERKDNSGPAEVQAQTFPAGKSLPSKGVDPPKHPDEDAAHHMKVDKTREDAGAAPDRHIEAIRIHHEQRRQMQEDKMNEVMHMEKQKNFAKASLDRYFSSLENIYRGSSSNQSSLPQTEEESEDTPEEEPQSDEGGQQTSNGDEEDAFTSVTATSVKAGGITERLEGLGIDVEHVKPKEGEGRNEGLDDKQKKQKKVKVCPGCASWNKDYMSWCADCGEILIGVEAVVAKKKEKRKVKPVGKESKEDVKHDKSSEQKIPVPSTKRNTSISPEILSYRHDEHMQVSVTKPDVDSHFNQLDNAKQALGVPAFASNASTSFARSPQEINDLCEVISDPVIRGFIKNYFSRKGGPADTPGNQNTGEEEQGEETPKADADNELSDGEVILNLAASVDSTAAAKTSKNASQKDNKYRDHGDIDVEIFGIEESRQSRTSSRNAPVVPVLDLHDSSDDEEVIQRRRLAMATQPVSFSIDTDDMSSVNDSQQLNPDDYSSEFPADSGMPPPNQSFLNHILAMRSSRGNDKPQRPLSADLHDRKRTTKSVVRESIEAEPYQRHWQRSSIAWGSYHPRELNTRSSLQNAMMRDTRVRSSNSVENLASDNRRTDGKPQSAAHTFKKARPASADLYRRKAQLQTRPTSAQVRSSQKQGHGRRDEEMATPTLSPSQPNIIPHRLPPEETQTAPPLVLQGPSSAITAYNMYMEMTPRIQEGEFSKWQCLPDEIWLYIFSYLQHKDLACVSRACKQFCRIAVDDSLWKYMTVKKKDGICDEWLAQIASRHPVSLALIQCHGDNVTAKGLRELFRECADCLQELNFSRCSRGGLTGDSILLHASARCRNLTHVDASWCHVTDNGIISLSESSHRLESLCLNGCQMLSDEGIETVIKKHGSSLRVLEMFGCFNMTPKSIRCVATNCTNLITINLGQCFRLTDSCITQLSASLGRVEHLDLRGCKQIKDNCIRKIVRNCPRLKTITIANCPHISDAALIEIATYAMDVRSIDICGCRHVTDRSIRTLANNCQRLTQLDISSSGCSHHSVLLLANYCNRSLEVLKLNFLADVTEASLQKLVKHCKKLKTLHLYGCTSVRSIDKLKQICPFLHVEM